jgi:hypothetical protein
MPHSKYKPFFTTESTNGMAESQMMRLVMIDLKISRAVFALLVVRSKMLTSVLRINFFIIVKNTLVKNKIKLLFIWHRMHHILCLGGLRVWHENFASPDSANC